MRLGRTLLTVASLFAAPLAASGEVIKFKEYVVEDETVLHSFAGGDGTVARPRAYDEANQHHNLLKNATYPDGLYVSSLTEKGHTYYLKSQLLSGVYRSTVYNTWMIGRFYLKFNLASIPDGYYLSKATLFGRYIYDRTPSSDQTHSIYYVPNDGWREKHPTKTIADLNADRAAPYDNPFPTADLGITWDNQPGYDAGFGAVATFLPSQMGSYGYKSWDITSVVQHEYAVNDFVLSLMFRADDESEANLTLSMEEFNEKDNRVLDDQRETCGFYIEFEFLPVPEPGALGALAGMVVTGCLLACRRRAHAV